jgi:hypothetical protein
VARRTCRRGSAREEAGSRPSAGHDEEGRSDRRAGRRSSYAAEGCDDGSHHDAGYTHGADHDGRSSRRREEAHSRRGHGSRVTESDSARAGGGCRFEAASS